MFPRHVCTSEFILNRVCEEVRSGVDCPRGFKEHHLHCVCNDVLDFIGLEVTISQVHNHLRRWRKRWALVCKVRTVEGVTLCKESTALMIDEDKLKAHLMVSLDTTACSFLLTELD
jgi:hypothetical protein